MPQGAGARVGVAVVLRTGSVALGEFAFEAPRVEVVEPPYLVFGERRPRIMCGQSLGSMVEVRRTLSFGGLECSGMVDLSLSEAEAWAAGLEYPAIEPRMSAALLPVSGCIRCDAYDWDNEELSGLEPWDANTLQLEVAGQAAEFAGVELMTPPRVLQLAFSQCSDTLGGNSDSAIDVQGLGFGKGPDDVEFVLLSGFDLERYALAAGRNRTSVLPGVREGLLSAHGLLTAAGRHAMGVPDHLVGVAIPVTDAISALQVEADELEPAVWISSESIRLVLPPGAGADVQVRV